MRIYVRLFTDALYGEKGRSITEKEMTMRKNRIPVLGALALSMGMMGGCSGNRSATDTTAIQETASVQEPGIMVIRQIRQS